MRSLSFAFSVSMSQLAQRLCAEWLVGAPPISGEAVAEVLYQRHPLSEAQLLVPGTTMLAS